MSELEQCVSDLKTLWNQPNANPAKTVETFRKLQIYLIKNHGKVRSNQELVIAMEGLEIGAAAAVTSGNLELFQRVYAQLKQFYNRKQLRNSAKNRQYLMGLHLMFLLTKGAFDEFHTELELLEYSDLTNNYIKFPMTIEANMMEGSYNKVLGIRDTPDKNFGNFLQQLETSVREEIAKSLEVVHDEMPLSDAIAMLKIPNPDALNSFVAETNRNWNVTDNTLRFQPTEAANQEINAFDTTRDMLEFTSNIETIV